MEETFKKLGHILLPDLFTPEKCQRYAEIMFDLHAQNRLQPEQTTNPGFYKNSYGIGSHPVFEAELIPVGDHIMGVLGIKMRPANSYARIYTNGSTLPKHVDRPGLDYTLTVSLYTDLDQPWLFWAHGLDGRDVACNIPVGSAGFILGRKITHWRDPLVCRPDQRTVQLFLHWSDI